MKTFRGYINYGCLATEKRPVFTGGNPHPTAAESEPVEYTVPEGWLCDETETGIVLTAPWGWTYSPNELLEGKENPYFCAINKDGKEIRTKLEWRNINMKNANVFNLGKFFAYAEDVQIAYDLKKGHPASQTIGSEFYERVSHGYMTAADAVNKMTDKMKDYESYLSKLNDPQIDEMLNGGKKILSNIHFDEMPQKVTESDEIAAQFAVGFMSGGKPIES